MEKLEILEAQAAHISLEMIDKTMKKPYGLVEDVLGPSWVVIAILLVSAILVVRNPQTIPTFGQNFFEYVLEFIRDVSKTQIGEEYGSWVPFVGTMFLFIFVSNWSGALLPWKIIQLPHGELAAPTNDINTTVALALLTSVAYFYAGLSKKGLAYFGKYIQPTPILLPINILEDFTKPLSLSFRLFGNILADELVVVVLVSLVPLVVWHLDVGSSPPGAVVCSKGWTVHPLKRYVSWVQNIMRQFGPYPVWALEH
ncbi:uncharacterized protein LOC110266878 [Arachis ipaensis]|uniref:uncharacterized protein LOC110266878 n=1 Tax=Arachis ipaensis TaxID=130454 RepID=UPI000A2B5452|nr:uncharacterized protein LOC110266878 [Arachis ipaensis]XP_025678603.1 uncharacterized protein LOC112778509 [Arachis hypogaea]